MAKAMGLQDRWREVFKTCLVEADLRHYGLKEVGGGLALPTEHPEQGLIFTAFGT